MANPERKVPVFKTENSIIDQEFSSIRERFDTEMKRMEHEMDRFRSEIAGKQLLKRKRERERVNCLNGSLFF